MCMTVILSVYLCLKSSTYVCKYTYCVLGCEQCQRHGVNKWTSLQRESLPVFALTWNEKSLLYLGLCYSTCSDQRFYISSACVVMNSQQISSNSQFYRAFEHLLSYCFGFTVHNCSGTLSLSLASFPDAAGSCFQERKKTTETTVCYLPSTTNKVRY